MSGLPIVDDALWDLADLMQFQRSTKTAVDGETVEKFTASFEVTGVMLPLPPRELLVKPEGQRSWRWWELYTDHFFNLDDVIRDEDMKVYRVMSVENWKDANYRKYQLTEGPVP